MKVSKSKSVRIFECIRIWKCQNCSKSKSGVNESIFLRVRCYFKPENKHSGKIVHFQNWRNSDVFQILIISDTFRFGNFQIWANNPLTLKLSYSYTLLAPPVCQCMYEEDRNIELDVELSCCWEICLQIISTAESWQYQMSVPRGYADRYAYYIRYAQLELMLFCSFEPVSYTHLTLPTIYSV